MSTNPTLFSDFLEQLGVPHTVGYSDSRFASMPFKSVFGLSKLLEEYGVPNEGVKISDKEEIKKLSVPFLAQTPEGFVIVTKVDKCQVEYISQGVDEEVAYNTFVEAWTGMALLAYPKPEAMEPGYMAHAGKVFVSDVKKWVLWCCVAALFLYLFITNGIYADVSTFVLTLLNIAGLGFTYLLLQKSRNIHSPVADRVCGIVQEGGCDHVLETKASSFFGIFSWSEVGFAYFTVSLVALLVFPDDICYLGAINVCCLPFSFWSVWYQKFKVKAWCTLCLSVQAILWLSFFCYLLGEHLHDVFPLRMPFFVTGVCYLTVLLALNKLLPRFGDKPEDFGEEESDGGSDPI